MAYRKININPPLYDNIDSDELVDQSAERHDTYRDDAGVTVRRPGLVEFADFGTYGIDGLYYWGNTGLVYAVTSGKFYSLALDGTKTLIDSTLFNDGVRPTFTESQYPTSKMFAANGGKIVVYDGTTASAMADAEAPTAVTHVNVFDTYLTANEVGTEKMHYSVVGTPESWNAEFIRAEGSPDNILAVGTGWGEIALFGERTTESVYNDGVTPFAEIAAPIEYGIGAPYSLKKIDNSWFYLNNERRVVRLNGRSPQVLSVPVDRFIADLTTVSDALGDHVQIGGRTFYVLTFPTDGKTIVYDYVKNEWAGEWNWWNTVTAQYQRWRGNCVLYVPEWDKHLVGDYASGKVYYLDRETYQDGSNLIRSSWVTGHIDHNTSRMKRSNSLRIKVRSGEGGSSGAVLMLRWRDNGSKTWSNSREINLGKTGEYEFFKDTFRLGMYMSRQYEISITDNVPLSLISVEEDVELLK